MKFTFTSQLNNGSKRRARILSFLASLAHARIHTFRTRYVKKIPFKYVLPFFLFSLRHDIIFIVSVTRISRRKQFIYYTFYPW